MTTPKTTEIANTLRDDSTELARDFLQNAIFRLGFVPIGVR